MARSDRSVVVAGARTPMAEYNGLFSDLSATDLAVLASREALSRSTFEPGEIEHVIFGMALGLWPLLRPAEFARPGQARELATR